MLKKIAAFLHLWLGLISGVIVFVISLTGCLYVFEAELRSWVEHPFTHFEATPSEPRLPVSALHAVGLRALRKATGQPLDSVQYASVSLYSAADRTALFYAYDEAQQLYHHVYIHPHTGEVLRIKNRNRDFFTLVIDLHTRLLLPRAIGHHVVGASVFVFVVMLTTGIILWWPRNKAALKQRFAIKWNARWRRVNYDLHNVNGFYFFPLALIIAVTGLVWSYEWVGQSIYWMANGGTPVTAYTEPQSVAHGRRQNTLLADSLADALRQQFPEAAYYSIDFPSHARATLNVGVYPDESVYYNSSYYSFDQYTGQLVKAEVFDQMNAGEKLRAMNYDIHIGKILGLPGQILAFAASLVASLLPITGLLIWRGRRNKNDPRHKVHETSQILVFKTNIASEKQVEEAAVSLSRLKGIVSWTVDRQDHDHVLRVVGKSVRPQHVEAGLRARGLICREMEE